MISPAHFGDSMMQVDSEIFRQFNESNQHSWSGNCLKNRTILRNREASNWTATNCFI